MAHFELCDFCSSTGSVDEMTAIHIEDKDGVPHVYYFHNTLENACLKAKIEELQKQFPQPDPA
jgi:hypothetical protein